MGEERMTRTSCEEWKPFMAMVVVDFAFAVLNILLKKVLDQGLDHLVLVTYRLTISAIFLAPISYFWERDGRPKLTVRILCYLFLSAIVGASLTQYLFLLGIQYTSATFACAFVNMVPVTTFLMALPFGLEAVNIKCNSGKAKVIGTLVCIGGGAILLLYKGVSLFDNNHSHATIDRAITKLSSSKKAERWMIGSIALIMGTLSWSSWFLLQSNIGKRYPYQYSSTAIMSFFGAIQSAILSFSTGSNLSVWILKGPLQIVTVVFAGMVGSGLGFVTMSWCVKKRGPVFTAAFSPLVQIMAAMIDIPILHESLYLGNVIGSVVVIIGLYILLWGKKKEMQNFANKLAQETEENKIQEPQLQAITISSESQAVAVSSDSRHS
ncbi:hypothetical protein CsatB_004895 [Cannabis sativa]|uniref:WAT1-related protein n=1 Tax=Cannabis sativa TaxID=3483 RepID=A0A7J6E5Z0_CANSA|nr:WAT1-related protein At3g30340 [Cannabis sativa]KAF4353069.1 hypothetical protein F8388_016914 [Cannabis sativa]